MLLKIKKILRRGIGVFIAEFIVICGEANF